MGCSTGKSVMTYIIVTTFHIDGRRLFCRRNRSEMTQARSACVQRDQKRLIHIHIYTEQTTNAHIVCDSVTVVKGAVNCGRACCSERFTDPISRCRTAQSGETFFTINRPAQCDTTPQVGLGESSFLLLEYSVEYLNRVLVG